MQVLTMDFQFTVVSYVLLANLIMTGGIAIYSSFRSYARHHQVYFTLLLLAITQWSLCAFLESGAPTIEMKILWSKLEYIGAMSASVFLYIYARGTSRFINTAWLRQFSALWILPAIVVLIAFTNEYHHLLWSGFRWSNAGNNILVYNHGPAFFAAISYSLILVLSAQIHLFIGLKSLPEQTRKQAWSIIIACFFPLLSTFIYASDLSPIEGLDISVLSFSFSGVILVFGISRYNLLDMIPVARARITEIIPDGIIISDASMKILFYNPAASQILNLPAKNAHNDLEQLPWLKEACNDFLNSDHGSEKEYILQADDNTWFNVMMSQVNDNNKLIGLLIIIRNISPRKKLESEALSLNKELITSAEELSGLNLQKDRILSIIGHDLRTSFHQITSLVHIIHENADSMNKEDILELLKDVNTASWNGYRILEELLEWARNQRKEVKVKPVDIQLKKLISEITDTSGIGLMDKNIEVIVQIPDDASAFADKDMMTIVFRNLLANAIKFSFPGGIIEIKGHRDEIGFLVLQFKDNGIGIAENDLAKLFNPSSHFTTTGTSGETGTGLGLILCKEMVIKNKGSIEVKSKKGEGSTFTIKLPVPLEITSISAEAPIIENPDFKIIGGNFHLN